MNFKSREKTCWANIFLGEIQFFFANFRFTLAHLVLPKIDFNKCHNIYQYKELIGEKDEEKNGLDYEYVFERPKNRTKEK